MLQHKGRHRRCNINVVFSLSIVCFNSAFSLVTFLFGYIPIFNQKIKGARYTRVHVILE